MARIKIDLPQRFLFETEIAVRVYDLNYGAHLGNDRVLALFHEARVRFFKTLGIDNERDGLDGLGVIMTDAAVAYKAESFYGDKLVIKMTIADLTPKTMDVLYLAENKERNTEVARGKTGLVCFDYHRERMASIPQKFREKIKEMVEQ